MQAAGAKAVLRPGGGVRYFALLQYLQLHGGSYHHGESQLCRTAAQAVPPRLWPAVRPPAGAGPAGQDGVPDHGAKEAGPHHESAGLRPTAEPGAAYQLRHAGGGVLSGILPAGHFLCRGQRHRPAEALSPGADDLPCSGQPGAGCAAAGMWLSSKERVQKRQLCDVF